MVIEPRLGQKGATYLVLRKVYNGICLETEERKRLVICMRDSGFEMKIDDGKWHLLTNEEDFKR